MSNSLRFGVNAILGWQADEETAGLEGEILDIKFTKPAPDLDLMAHMSLIS